MQGKDLSSHELRYALVHLLARLADCPHNKQVMVEQEHEVLPAVLPLMIFPQHVGGFKVDTPKISLLHLCCTSVAPLLHLWTRPKSAKISLHILPHSHQPGLRWLKL
jgi:hypothetical protein